VNRLIFPGFLRCANCGLASDKKVPGTGFPLAQVMIIGEGPGADEELSGYPFVGRAGQLLTKALNEVGLERSKVYISNIVKCRPSGNRQPIKTEVEACRIWLLKEIELVSPKVIIALGNTAYGFFGGEKITKNHGRVEQWEGIVLIPTYHPAYLLRQDSTKLFNEFCRDLSLYNRYM